MPAADFKFDIGAVQGHWLLAIGGFFHAANVLDRHQCIAVNAHKLTGEFFFKQFEWLFDK